ncbi:MAG: hypothetical protein AMS27_05520 [Bacteroides sp. SM23_62_1]|nr:MAG: hypothetical protein AMS27_05520 [Bacteroides sp. SM23_62_1]
MCQHYLKFQLYIFLSLFVFLIPFLSFSQDNVSNQQLSITQPTYTTTRLVTEKPVIDGKLDDECWKHGTWAGDYHQWIPHEGAKPTWPTEFNIQYDDKNLYVAFRAFDGEPDKIVRMSSGRDEFAGDVMGITLDSYRDYRTGFEFTITAWGQKIDVVVFNPADWDINWNAVWKGKVGMEDSAWVAEMEIPLSQLRYSNQNEQVWGMHTWRLISRLQEESNWEIQSKSGPGMLYNFGELRGISELKKSRRLEIMPFILGDLNTMEKEPGNPFTENGRKWGGNMGLDAKIGVSSNFTVDLTVNPDFGQVESDPSVMNLTAFETFYEEKRPFFLEGLTIFNYDFDRNDLFYSRRIGHSPSRTVYPNDTLFVNSPDKTTILSAVKFSGTTSKGLSVGLIQSVTANEYAILSDQYDNRSESKVEPLTNYMVARIQKGYRAGNTVIGGMLTSTNRFIKEKSLEFLSDAAYTGGLDIRHHWKDKKYYLDARLLGSYVGGSKRAITALQESSARYFQRPGADYLDYDTTRTSLSGFGGRCRIGKGSKGLWKYSTGVSWLSPGLELNDLGYMNSADEINQENEVTYFVTRPVSIFHSFEITLEQFNTWNFNGTWLGSGGHLSFVSTFKNNWSFGTNLIFHSQGNDTRKLRGGPDMIIPNNLMTFGQVRTDPSKKLTFSFSYRYEKTGNTSASSYELGPTVSVRPFNALRLSLQADYEKNDDRLQYITTINYLTEKRYILGTIDQETFGITFRADLNLTPEFSIQYYGSPFISRGSYSEFKRITDPEAGNYDDRFVVCSNTVISGENIGLDENNDLLPDYFIINPDFNFHQARSNLVAKWEYRLGSFIYLVWSSERTGRNNDSHAPIGDSYNLLRNVYPDNIFLIKLSYWFSL